MNHWSTGWNLIGSLEEHVIKYRSVYKDHLLHLLLSQGALLLYIIG
jgi:hypothetical protein